MTTPIADFIDRYCADAYVRLHMPGHKGQGAIESLDITEFYGADALYEPTGIIAQSEHIAASLFGTQTTLYGAEGSSQCVKAMLLHAILHRHSNNVIAARNVHSSFLSACALLDLTVTWLVPKDTESLVSCTVTVSDVETAIQKNGDAACVFLTSPDYLGQILDIRAIADVCHQYHVPLLVDNAHGAYLAFLREQRHPIRLGADLCCDSAHKTLPTLTGGAYLHRSEASLLPESGLRQAMAVFGSTSPSYLILRSLDLTNRFLANDAAARFEGCCEQTERVKKKLEKAGFSVLKSDPLRIVIDCCAYGYTGSQIGRLLAKEKIMCEYADDRFLVLMATPLNSQTDFDAVTAALTSIEPATAIQAAAPPFILPERVCSLRQALFAKTSEVPIESAVGRVAGFFLPHCPPAVAPVVGGERINENTAKLLALYGYDRIPVITDEIFDYR